MKRSKWGTKMRTPVVQIFLGYKRSKWGTDGNPGSDADSLSFSVGFFINENNVLFK